MVPNLVGSNPIGHLNARSTNWIGNQPLKLEMLGSNPARVIGHMSWSYRDIGISEQAPGIPPVVVVQLAEHRLAKSEVARSWLVDHFLPVWCNGSARLPSKQ